MTILSLPLLGLARLRLTSLESWLPMPQQNIRPEFIDSQLAGVTGIVAILIIAFRYDHVSVDRAIAFNWRLLGTQSLLIALIVGCDWPNIPLAGDRA